MFTLANFYKDFKERFPEITRHYGTLMETRQYSSREVNTYLLLVMAYARGKRLFVNNWEG